MRAIRSPMGSLTICDPPLPARLDEAGDQPVRTEVAQGDPAHLQLAVVAARTARHLAAVADADGGRVPRQLGELQAGFETLLERQALVAGGRLQRGALGGVLLDELLDAFVAVDGALLGHVLTP